jgi:hypothetical protein
MPEVDLGIQHHMAQSVEEVCDARKQVAILFHDLIQPSEVYAKME